MLVTVKSENYFSYVLGSTYLEILRDDLTNIYIIIFYAVFKEQTIHIFRVYRRCIRFTCLA